MITSLLSNLQTGQKIGLTILISLVIFAGVEPLFSTLSSYTQNLDLVLAAPSSEHILGTDHYGRSMLSRMGDAVRLSFTLGVISVATAAVIGTTLGVWAAWGNARVAQGLDIIVNILLALPGLVVVLMFSAIVPGSFLMIYIAIALVQWIEYFRVVRAISQTVINSPEMQSSAMMGFGRWYLFKRHIWPQVSPSVLTLAAFGAAHAILTMASLSFVYVGLQPPTAELGIMIVELFPYYQEAPWALAQPLMVVALMVLGFHLLAGEKS